MSILALSALCFSCNNQPKDTAVNAADSANTTFAASAPVSPDAPIIKFEQDTYDFGTIQQNEKVTHVYTFTNTGKSPLIITGANASCGCTVPDYPKAPVGPGKSAEIKVVFDSAGKEGKVEKTVSINSNAATPLVTIFLTGEIEAAAKK